jgi:hypothetical protein
MNRTTHLVKRNFALGVINGAIYQIVAALVDPAVIVAAFVLHATGSVEKPLLWVAIVASAMSCGWSWPSVFISHILESQPRKMPYYRLSGAVRVCCLASVALVVWLMAESHPMATVALIAAVLFVHSSAGGVGMIPFYDTVSRSMPAHYLGRFFGMRLCFGGILGFGAGIVARYVLDESHGYAFPHSYVVLFAIASVAAVVSFATFSFCKDPPSAAHKRRVGFAHHLRRVPRILRRDPNYRTFLLTRTFLGLGTLATPFLYAFALARLNATEPMAGLFAAVVMVSSTLSNVLWSYVADTQGNRCLLLLTTTLGMVVQVAALASAWLPGHVVGRWFGLDFTPQLLLMCLAFSLSGFSLPGRMMGEMNLILEMSPERRRPTYLGVMYLLLFPLAFVPLLGAALIGQRERFELGFLAAFAFGALGLLMVLRLREPRSLNAEPEEWRTSTSAGTGE